jgi:hypothetical protein
LKQEVDEYYKYITNVDYVDLIRRFPSPLYNEATFNLEQVVQVKDPIYSASMFDVFAWWRTYGREKFKFIDLCALIVFGKPIHNGFQERVFSRGTFTDDQLRRKMKEETFELAILESINCDTVDKYMNYFRSKNKVDPVKVASSADKYLNHIKKLSGEVKNLLDSDSESETTETEGEEYQFEVEDFLEDQSDDEYISDF